MSWRDARQRRDEVKAAFMEGHRAGMSVREPEEAWETSTARRHLATPLPPGRAFCPCGSTKFRLAIGEDKWICDSCLRDAEPAVPLQRGPKPEPVLATSVGEAAARVLDREPEA